MKTLITLVLALLPMLVVAGEKDSISYCKPKHSDKILELEITGYESNNDVIFVRMGNNFIAEAHFDKVLDTGLVVYNAIVKENKKVSLLLGVTTGKYGTNYINVGIYTDQYGNMLTFKCKEDKQ